MLQTISTESSTISKIIGETTIMKWTIVPAGNPTGTFELFIQKPVLLRISYEVKEGKSLYDTSYTNRLTVVRSKSGNDIIITDTLTKLAYNDTNTYKLEVRSSPDLTSTINLDIKGL